MTQIIKWWFGDTYGRCSFGLNYPGIKSIDVVQLDDGSMGITEHLTNTFCEGPTFTWSAISIIGQVLSGVYGLPDYETYTTAPHVDWIKVDINGPQDHVWYCEAPACKHREVDMGHACYWCGAKQK